MLRQIWQSLKQIFNSLLALIRPQSKRSRNSLANHSDSNSLPPLSDTDYEFLFSQLLQGVNSGWHQKRVLSFFYKIGDRSDQTSWVSWLQRFGEKVLASPAPNQELAVRMVRFGQLTEFLPPIRRIGQESYHIGKELLNRQRQQRQSQIWEYSGSDSSDSIPETKPPTQETNQKTPSENKPVEALTPDQLLTHLYENPNIADALAKQLGLEGSNPEHLVEALVNQMLQFQTKTKSTDSPDGTTWLQKGYEKLSQGDLKGAVECYDQAIAISPNLAEAWYHRGSALENLGELPAALNNYAKAVELDGNNYIAWNDLAKILYKSQRWEEAIIAWDQVTRIKSDHYQAWYNKACALENLQRLPEAIASYQQALAIKPDFNQAESRLNVLRQQIEEQNQNQNHE